jgi:hypothetical protein
MIRQRVDRHGNISELEPESELPGCNLPISEIGVIKEGPVKKWMIAKQKWDVKFAATKRKVQKQRATEFAKGYQQFGGGEKPPPSALAGRRKLEGEVKEEKQKQNAALSMWARWGSKHDEEAIENEKQMEEGPDVMVRVPPNDADTRGTPKRMSHSRGVSQGHCRSGSRRRIVMDEHQTDESEIDEDTPAAVLYHRLKRERGEVGASGTTPDFLATPSLAVHPPPVDETELKRPKLGGIAFPFSLKQEGASASMVTLTSSVGVGPTADVRSEGARDSGVKANEADIEAAKAARRSSTAAGASQEHGNETGESSKRPPMETFVSAEEYLPTVSSM